MAKLLEFFAGCLVIVLISVALEDNVCWAAPANNPTEKANSEWAQQRRAEFYANSSFLLTDAHVRLLGNRFTQESSRKLYPIKTHLPFWFDYELYKALFNKRYPNPDEELERHKIYIKSCVRALKARVLYRILAGTRDTLIGSDADLFYEEKFKPLQQSSNSLQSTTREVIDQEINVAIILEPGDRTIGGGERESPVEMAIRLVRSELDKVESRNQLENYLKAFDEVDGQAFDMRLPWQ